MALQHTLGMLFNYNFFIETKLITPSKQLHLQEPEKCVALFVFSLSFILSKTLWSNNSALCLQKYFQLTFCNQYALYIFLLFSQCKDVMCMQQFLSCCLNSDLNLIIILCDFLFFGMNECLFGVMRRQFSTYCKYTLFTKFKNYFQLYIRVLSKFKCQIVIQAKYHILITRPSLLITVAQILYRTCTEKLNIPLKRHNNKILQSIQEMTFSGNLNVSTSSSIVSLM